LSLNNLVYKRVIECWGACSEKGIKKESLQCKANASCLPSRKKATHRQAGAATNELSKVNFATTINPY